MKQVLLYLSRPVFQSRFNGAAVIFWAIMIIPTLTIWHSEILWIALMSIWANLATHLAGWISAEVVSSNDPESTVTVADLNAMEERLIARLNRADSPVEID